MKNLRLVACGMIFGGGFLVMIIGLTMDTTVENINNLGLLAKSVALTIVGSTGMLVAAVLSFSAEATTQMTQLETTVNDINENLMELRYEQSQTT